MYVLKLIWEFVRKLSRRGEWGDRMHLFEKNYTPNAKKIIYESRYQHEKNTNYWLSKLPP